MQYPKPLACLLVLCWLLSPATPHAEEPTQEYQLKLAFLVNFARFISWPENSFRDNNLALCVLGDNPFGSALPGVDGKRAGKRQLQTRVIKELGEAKECHLLFVATEKLSELRRQSPRLVDVPLVTVGDAPGFVESGGGIEFVAKDDKLGFIINNTELKGRDITVGSPLLSLATAVR